MNLFARTMTPDECDRLLQRARMRRAEREARGGWIAHHRKTFGDRLYADRSGASKAGYSCRTSTVGENPTSPTTCPDVGIKHLGRANTQAATENSCRADASLKASPLSPANQASVYLGRRDVVRGLQLATGD